MKVLEINSFFTVGGPPRIMNGIYDVLKLNGHDCKIASAREKIRSPGDSYRIESSFAIYYNAIKARLFDADGFVAKQQTRKLVKKIKQYDPDIIHLHNLHGYYIDVETLFNYLKRAGKPVVWTLHDCWPITGHCAHFDVVHCEKWRNGGCNSCPQKKEYPRNIGVDRSEKNFKAKKAAFTGAPCMKIVTPSKWLKNYVDRSFLSEYETITIHNGVDTKIFCYKKSDVLQRYRISDKKIVLGVAQNWSERKGLDDFSDLAEMLSDDYKVVMIGVTDGEKKRLSSKILAFSRTQSAEELVEWYSAATVFVNCTYQDTFPTVNLEALACGAPVITYATGGSPEAVDSKSGIVVEQGNIRRIYEEIASLEQYGFTRKDCIQRAAAFERNQQYMTYIHVFETLCGK